MSKKLCKLVSDGFLDDHTKKYIQMVNEPKYVCMKCGRAANDEDSLCRPKKIKDKKEDHAEARKEDKRASKKEAKKIAKKVAKKATQKSEGYKQISEDLANEKMMKFDEKIQKRIVKISKSDLRHKKNPSDDVASVGSEAEIETKAGLEPDFKAEDVEKNVE
jgi:hypothetical protein